MIDIRIVSIEFGSREGAGPNGEVTLAWANARYGELWLTRCPMVLGLDGTLWAVPPGGRRRGVGWSREFGDQFAAAARAAAVQLLGDPSWPASQMAANPRPHTVYPAPYSATAQ